LAPSAADYRLPESALDGLPRLLTVFEPPMFRQVFRALPTGVGTVVWLGLMTVSFGGAPPGSATVVSVICCSLI
jgi:hypothetical protein